MLSSTKEMKKGGCKVYLLIVGVGLPPVNFLILCCLNVVRGGGPGLKEWL